MSTPGHCRSASTPPSSASPTDRGSVLHPLRTRLNIAFVAACGVVVATVFPARIVAPAMAAEPNRAALIVDTGEQVKKVCVRFWEESISGAELLQRAEVQAALRPYAGKGVAVCSLCGVGCRTDDSCLTCDPDGRYWAYSRAPAGSPDFRLSAAGASNTQVRNGDVEGWRWSRGTSPIYISVAEVCDGTAPAGTASPPTSAAPAVTTTTMAAGSSTTSGPGLTRTPARAPTAAAINPASTTVPPVPTTASTAASTTEIDTTPSARTSDVAAPAAGDPRPTSREGKDDEGAGSPAGLIGFAAVLAGLLGWARVIRHRRTGSPPA